jgi:hypothetical protein
MIVATVAFFWALALLDALLSALKTVPAGALLTTPKVSLFSGSTVVSQNSTYASFTKCVFSGYADQTLTLSGPVNLPGIGQALIGTVTFVQSGGTTGDTATGYFVSDGTATFYGGERLANPVAFAVNGDFLTVNVILPLPYYQPA